MALFGWASIDENGKGRGGKAGDQKQESNTNDTKGEVRVGQHYTFGQEFVIRYKSEAKAKKHAKALKSLCNNKHLGYDMNERTTLNKQLEKIGYENYEKLSEDCETDCSDLQDVCAKIAGAINTTVATSGMKSAYGNDDDFIILTDKKYLTTGDYLLEGDMSVAPGHHTIGCIESGAKSKNETRAITTPGCATKTNAGTNTGKGYYTACNKKYTSIVDALNSIGVDSSKANRTKIANANGITGYKGTASQNTSMLSLLKAGKLKKY
jgi:hypothetical protein